MGDATLNELPLHIAGTKGEDTLLVSPEEAITLPADWSWQLNAIFDSDQGLATGFAAIAAKLQPVFEVGARIVETVAPALAFAATPEFKEFRERFNTSLPDNWRQVLALDRQMVSLACDNGIPIVWVSRASILNDLLAAPDYASRVAVLIARRDEIVEDCQRCVVQPEAPELSDLRAFTSEAIFAFRGTYFAAAEALAVIVSERLIRDYMTPDGPKGSMRELGSEVD